MQPDPAAKPPINISSLEIPAPDLARLSPEELAAHRLRYAQQLTSGYQLLDQMSGELPKLKQGVKTALRVAYMQVASCILYTLWLIHDGDFQFFSVVVGVVIWGNLCYQIGALRNVFTAFEQADRLFSYVTLTSNGLQELIGCIDDRLPQSTP